ncbi:MAG TPA: GNAT family N-acetyltransferase [Crocinitomix sp.]|nr:GNAT family N-acetyltransferase [Crocinitomix sp.]
MIKKLNWDSAFFGYKVGRTNWSDNINVSDFIKQASNFKLIYVFSDSKIKHDGALLKNLKFMEQKVTFLKSVKQKEIDETTYGFFNINSDSKSELLELALLSGVESRFKKDNNFKQNEFEKLYFKWIENCLNDNASKKIIVKKENNHIVGFTTLENLNTNQSKIGLIAVDAQHHRKGIAKGLINFAEHISFKHHCKSLEVTTQSHNLSAMKLYKHFGFNLIFTNYIYHYWNL